MDEKWGEGRGGVGGVWEGERGRVLFFSGIHKAPSSPYKLEISFPLSGLYTKGSPELPPPIIMIFEF